MLGGNIILINTLKLNWSLNSQELRASSVNFTLEFYGGGRVCYCYDDICFFKVFFILKYFKINLKKKIKIFKGSGMDAGLFLFSHFFSI